MLYEQNISYNINIIYHHGSTEDSFEWQEGKDGP